MDILRIQSNYANTISLKWFISRSIRCIWVYKLMKHRFPIYFTDKEKIDFVQRVILIHSYLYYSLDSSVISDKSFDESARYLFTIQNLHDSSWIKSNTQYGYVFYDFDGNTGFDLFEKLNNSDKKLIIQLSYKILYMHRCLEGRTNDKTRGN